MQGAGVCGVGVSEGEVGGWVRQETAVGSGAQGPALVTHPHRAHPHTLLGSHSSSSRQRWWARWISSASTFRSTCAGRGREPRVWVVRVRAGSGGTPWEQPPTTHHPPPHPPHTRPPASHLRVAVGAHVAVEEGGGRVEQRAQLVSVGKVAIVDEVDPKRRVDKEGLRLGGRGRPSGWVAHVADAHGACACGEVGGWARGGDAVCPAAPASLPASSPLTPSQPLPPSSPRSQSPLSESSSAWFENTSFTSPLALCSLNLTHSVVTMPAGARGA